MHDVVRAAAESYLEADPATYLVPAWWVKTMQTSGVYKQGLLSNYDPGFVLPVGGNKRISMITYMVSWLSQEERPWLVLIGDKGVGKTYLAKILGTLWMMKECRLAKHIAWTVWLNEQRARIGKSMAGKNVGDLPDVASLYKVPFLIVDDLSTGRVGASTWALETLFALMEARSDRRTIFIANAPLADIITEAGQRKHSPYRQQLEAQAARANGDRETYLDLVEKVCDRFSQGIGSQALHILVKSITGQSYRTLV